MFERFTMRGAVSKLRRYAKKNGYERILITEDKTTFHNVKTTNKMSFDM